MRIGTVSVGKCPNCSARCDMMDGGDSVRLWHLGLGVVTLPYRASWEEALRVLGGECRNQQQEAMADKKAEYLGWFR